MLHTSRACADKCLRILHWNVQALPARARATAEQRQGGKLAGKQKPQQQLRRWRSGRKGEAGAATKTAAAAKSQAGAGASQVAGLLRPGQVAGLLSQRRLQRAAPSRDACQPAAPPMYMISIHVQLLGQPAPKNARTQRRWPPTSMATHVDGRICYYSMAFRTTASAWLELYPTVTPDSRTAWGFACRTRDSRSCLYLYIPQGV